MFSAGNSRTKHQALWTIFSTQRSSSQSLLKPSSSGEERTARGAIRLARALRRTIIIPLFNVLDEEKDASMRKFLLSMLEAIGSDVIPLAVKRLADSRWFVVRNHDLSHPRLQWEKAAR